MTNKERKQKRREEIAEYKKNRRAERKKTREELELELRRIAYCEIIRWREMEKELKAGSKRV
jgi:hypothetical protein